MNGRKAKHLRNKAAVVAQGDRTTTYTTPTQTKVVGDDTFTITDTIRLTKGCFRDIYRDFKRFTKQPQFRNKPLARI